MVRSVARAVSVLQLVARSAVPMSLHAISGASGMPKSTAFTILKTLVDAGLLEMRGDRTYATANGLQQLASLAARPTAPDVRALAKPHLALLAKSTGESILLGLPDGDEVIYVDKIDCPSPIRYIADIGTHRPMHCTASGKLCLSLRDGAHVNDYLRRVGLKAYTKTTITDPALLRIELERIRSRGYSVSNCEYLEDVMTVAAPIVDLATGQLVAIVAVAGPAYRMRKQRVVAARACLQAAARIAQDLASPSPPEPGSTPSRKSHSPRKRPT